MALRNLKRFADEALGEPGWASGLSKNPMPKYEVPSFISGSATGEIGFEFEPIEVEV